MKYELAKPQKDIEKQLKTIFTFVLEKGHLDNIAHPKTLVDGWHNGQIKLFTATDADKLVGVCICLVIKDPIKPLKYHVIKSLNVGNEDEAFTAFVDNALVVYR